MQPALCDIQHSQRKSPVDQLQPNESGPIPCSALDEVDQDNKVHNRPITPLGEELNEADPGSLTEGDWRFSLFEVQRNACQEDPCAGADENVSLRSIPRVEDGCRQRGIPADHPKDGSSESKDAAQNGS